MCCSNQISNSRGFRALNFQASSYLMNRKEMPEVLTPEGFACCGDWNHRAKATASVEKRRAEALAN
jgi:hypothetical protein